MTDAQRSLVQAIRDYADDTLAGRCPEGHDLLSALVNTVDTAQDPIIVRSLRNIEDRKIAVADFILAHHVF